MIQLVPRHRDDTTDDFVRKLVEKFREIMLTGLPKYGIPIMDPLQVIDIHLDSGMEDLP